MSIELCFAQLITKLNIKVETIRRLSQMYCTAEVRLLWILALQGRPYRRNLLIHCNASSISIFNCY